MPNVPVSASSSHRRPAGRVPLGPPSCARAAVIFLTAAIALAMAGLALVLGAPVWASGAPAAMAHEALARQFYTALDGILAGGDPHALDALVAPGVVVHVAGRQLDGVAALERYVAATGAASPGQHVTAKNFLASGDWASAAVVRVASAQPAPGIVIDGSPTRLDGTETFRLADARIVEYWSMLDDQSLPRALPPSSISLPSGMKQSALARFALPPGAALADLTLPGPHLLLPETGTFTVTVDGDAQIVHAEAGADGWRTVSSKQAIPLGPGDALLVPAGARHAIRNDTAGGATMLGLLIFTLADVAGMQILPPVAALYVSAPYGRLNQFGTATGAPLARGFDACAACQSSSLRVLWLPLAPGQSIAPRPAPGMEFLAVEAGAIWLDVIHPAAEAPSNMKDVAAMEPRVVAAGDAVANVGGLSAPAAAATNAPASLVAIEVESAAPFRAASSAGS